MTASEHIDDLIAKLTDWRGNMLANIRKTILAADRDIIEQCKWMGSPVWSRDGNIVVGNAHKNKVKLTFPQGAHLPDPEKLFNAGLDGKQWRAIDLFEGDQINKPALKNLIQAAVVFNQKKQQDRQSQKLPAGKN
ncbi:MAG: DUF1801 domain-containing protein [Advenella sp.]